MKNIPERISALSPEQRALLERRLKQRGLNLPAPQGIPKRSATDSPPLSFAQERLWFLDQLEPGSPLYNMPAAIRLMGQLNVAALEQSINQIVQRHEALRTTFATEMGQSFQVIAPVLVLKLPVVDLQDIPETEREIQVLQLITEEIQRPFVLSRGPLLRTVLLKLGAGEHVTLLTMHHIISDGWSRGVLIKEMAALYKAFSNGEPARLRELPIQYADFAIWQRKWLQGEVLETQLAYWEEQLSGAPAVLELFSDRPRPPVQSSRGSRQHFVLPRSLTEALKAFSRREGVTLFMTLLAVFKVLLCRYTGQTDIVVGSPVANRNRSEIEELLGFFVNTLVLRTDLSGNPTFLELLDRVREKTLGAYAHQDLPFEMLVEKLRPERDLSHTPLFQVMFVLQNAPTETMRLPGLTLNLLKVDDGTAKFDLSLVLMDAGQGVEGALEYNSDLFDDATVTRIAIHFQALLEGVVANPRQRLSDLPLLTDAERRQLLVEWNNTQTDYPQDVCVHQLIESQAARTPDAVAVVSGNRHMTYQELNRRANQLAHHLQALGVGPEVLVGICLERSLEIVVGLLGTLKTGGAYVPLDPGYPKERLAFMLDDTQAPVLLIQQQLVEQLPTLEMVTVCLDTDWQTIAQKPDENPDSRATPGNLAYVIYTSGSTGKPKGTLILHRGLVNYLTWCQRAYPLAAGQGAPLYSSISFDLTITSLFAPLLAGRRVQVLPKDPSVDLLSEMLRNETDYSLVKITPAHLKLLSQQLLPEEAVGRTQAFIIGGENLLAKSITFWQDHAPDTMLINEYGPTETVVGCCVYQVPPGERRVGSVPIGHPIINTQLYILDADLCPVPIGIPGELHIGGVGVARGYLNRPELTAKKFVPNPFSDEPGTRLYKTGDLTRYLPDGNIEFLGRMDHQVKVRGFRIELDEIEAVLNQHPAVREVVAVVRDAGHAPGDKRLVAYVVPRARFPTVSELRGFLRENLPDYMIPSIFVPLEALPLTPSGKVDRRSLPAPDRTRPHLGETSVAPRTPVEETLVLLWSQFLDLEQVGIHDNFFELGGDSILSIQIIAQARQVGFQFTPKQLFQHQTIAELAAVVDTISVSQAEQGPVTGPVPLTPIQHWFFEQRLSDPHHFNQAILLEVQQVLHPALLAKSLQHLLAHHDALRLRFAPGASGWQQVNVPPDEMVPFSQVDLSALPEAAQELALATAATELQASLNLTVGPLLRVALFELGTQRPSRLLLIIHHLVVDGVSWRILLEDLQAAYRQLGQGKTVVLPSKTTSFKRWVERLVAHAQLTTLREELNYWLTLAHQVSRLPVDHPVDRDANTVASACTVSVSLVARETRRLLREVPNAYRTQINDILLTALVQALSSWTGMSTVLIDLEGHGREAISENVDLSRTVGWFTSLFPVRLDLGEIELPGDALKSIKEQLRTIPNRGIGYGLLCYLSKDVKVARQLRGVPWAEVSFNYLGQLDQVLAEPSLLKLAQESSGPSRSPRGIRSHLIEINGSVVGKRLRLDWTYSENVHQRSTVENLAQGFMRSLRSLISHCLSPEAGGYTPSDFPLAKLDQQALDHLLGGGRGVEDLYPLSPMQQGMLFHTLRAPKSGVYFEQLSCTIDGKLNIPEFEIAWQRVLDRHPALRTSFIWEGLDEPVQVVHRQVGILWEYQDWRGLSPAKQREQLEAFLHADRERGFDLYRAPLLRLTLMRIAENTHYFVWSHHHILLDGWSTSWILKELFSLYGALCQDQNLHLPISRPYRDYIAWLKQQDLLEAKVFWREALKGFTTPTLLGADRGLESSSSETLDYGEQQIELSATATAALYSFARRHQLTPNILVRGAWALLLSRYSGKDDIVFGATVSGRPASLAGVESTVGLFINTQPIRVQITAGESLLPWLHRLQAQLAELHQYEYSPLAEVQRWSQVPRGTPLFESVLVFENQPVDTSLLEQLVDIDIRVCDLSYRERTNCPLLVTVGPGSKLSLKVVYNRRHFDVTTITQMLAHFQTLLEDIVGNPDKKLSEVKMISDEESEQFGSDFNADLE